VRRKIIFKIITLITVICILISQTAYAAGTIDNSAYLKAVMDNIKDKYYTGQVTDGQLLEGALKGMYSTMDPYTGYMTNAEMQDFSSQINGTFVGIGISFVVETNYVLVTDVIEGSPAQNAGIIDGDRIYSVDGKGVSGLSEEKVAALIKGEAGTKVVLGAIKNGQTKLTSITITRAEIKVNPVSYKIKGNIGYIKIDIFNANTQEYFDKALAEMDKKKITRIILDLRNNPGGAVDQAVAVAKKLVPKGLIAKLDFKSESLKDEEYYSDLPKINYKLAVLVNGMSASASEILSGAIQDTKAGTLIGTKTFGKAKVQNVFPILTPEAYDKYSKQYGVNTVDAYELLTKYSAPVSWDEIQGWTKITTGLYTTPKGRMIDGVGLTPDVAVADSQLVKGVDVDSIGSLKKVTKPTLNSESIDVYNAEKILRLSGYNVDTPDMKLDKKTFEAIKKFQKDSKLYSYGVLDFTTQQALNNKLDKLVPSIDKQYAEALKLVAK
jgi:carboxyl-terminal processing protease